MPEPAPRPPQERKDAARPVRRRLLPLAVVALAVAAFFATGLHRRFDLDAVALSYGALAAAVEANLALAVALAVAIYTLATALALPIGLAMTVITGLVFGWALGWGIVLVSATTGATLLFLMVRSALAEMFTARAGKRLGRIAAGFREDAANYLLFLRLAPVVPFWLLNLVAATAGVRLKTFVWTTLVGIMPGTLAYSVAGEGLRSLVAERAEACADNRPPCGSGLGLGDLVTPQILVALTLLGLVALAPVALRRWRSHKVGD